MAIIPLKAIPYPLRRRMEHRVMEVAKWFRTDGVLPDVLIIGAMKSGTTTLFDMMCEHPGFLAPLTKEIEYFTNPRNFSRGVGWYRAHFPSRRAMQRSSRALGYKVVTGEATPGMSTPFYATNARDVVPAARLIVTMRNPVDRAWSHFQHMRRIYRSDATTFMEAIKADLDAYYRGEALTPENFRREWPRLVIRNYVQRGHYAEQIEHWLDHFPRDQFLFLNFDDWRRCPSQAANAIARFSGLPEHSFTYRKSNTGSYDESMPAQCRRLLTAHYRPHNRRLFDLLGEDWRWPA
jgi:hypothetical protein